MADSYDVIVIGGGPGGYHAAIRAAQLGKNTAVVEMDKPGGRCLNYACIPAKTMLHTAEILDHAQNSAELGVTVKGAALDWKALGERRAKVSETLSGGVKMLWDKNKVTMIEGKGALDSDANVVVDGTTYEAGAVILATGSVALAIPGVEFSDRVVDTWGAWSLPSLPKSIAVVGAGASGAEIASAYVRYGTEVTLIEMLPQILPAEDKDVVRVVERVFKKQGIKILTGNPISDVEAGSKSVKAKVGDEAIEVEYLAIAGGRAPDTEGLGLDAAGVKTGRRRQDRDRPVSAAPRTRRCSRSATSSAARRSPTRPRRRAWSRPRRSPAPRRTRSTSTWSPGPPSAIPQVASVGLTEQAAKDAGKEIKTARMKLGGVGASAVYDDRDGLVKLVVDSEYGEIVGAHIVGNRACDMIAELVDTIALEGGYQELARIIHPHPTISEAILDAARAVDGWAIHQ